MNFGDDISKWCEEAQVAVNKECIRIFQTLSTSIVMLTPSPSFPGRYAKGHLANQWYPAQGGAFSTELSLTTSSIGSNSLSRINALVNSVEFLGKDGTMTLTNNLDYAYRAEMIGWTIEDGWTGKVGPYRMVALSIQKIMNMP